MAASPLNIQALFASLPDEVRNAPPQQFQQQLDSLPLPKPVKADLWDMRFTPAPDPQQFTEAPGVPPSVEAPPPSAASTAATPQTVDPAPASQTPLDLPVKPVRKLPQPATSIGPLPQLTGPTAVDPATPPTPTGPVVNVPMSATPALNAGAPVSGDLYQQVANIARTNPSFGTAKIQRETGARHADISAALDRLVNEGLIRRTQNARRSVVFHAL